MRLLISMIAALCALTASAEALAHGRPQSPQASATPRVVMSALESSVVGRMNAERGARGLWPLRVSRGLTAAAEYHSRQMGLFGFFEHESRNGGAFWRRIERFYPSRGYRAWSVGENIQWQSHEATARSAVRVWMASPPHRKNILSREWREVGLAAVHFDSARGEYEQQPVTILTADFGTRR